MGCGADVTREAGDVRLLTSDVNLFVHAIVLARHTVRVIRQNLFWAFAYNMIGIGLACSGKLNPMWAAAAMTVSSVAVVTNSLRLRRRGVGRGRPSARIPCGWCTLLKSSPPLLSSRLVLFCFHAWVTVHSRGTG